MNKKCGSSQLANHLGSCLKESKQKGKKAQIRMVKNKEETQKVLKWGKENKEIRHA